MVKVYKLHTASTEPNDEQAGSRVQEELALEVPWYFERHQLQPTTRACKWCGARIYWADAPWSPWGMMPIDVEPCEDGNFTLSLDRQSSVLRTYQIERMDARSLRRVRNRYKAHFETCGQAASRLNAHRRLDKEIRSSDAVRMVREVFGVEIESVQITLNETA